MAMHGEVKSVLRYVFPAVVGGLLGAAAVASRSRALPADKAGGCLDHVEWLGAHERRLDELESRVALAEGQLDALRSALTGCVVLSPRDAAGWTYYVEEGATDAGRWMGTGRPGRDK